MIDGAYLLDTENIVNIAYIDESNVWADSV